MDILVTRSVGLGLAFLAGMGFMWIWTDPHRPLTLDVEVAALPHPRIHIRITLGAAVSIGQHPTY